MHKKLTALCIAPAVAVAFSAIDAAPASATTAPTGNPQVAPANYPFSCSFTTKGGPGPVYCGTVPVDPGQSVWITILPPSSFRVAKFCDEIDPVNLCAVVSSSVTYLETNTGTGTGVERIAATLPATGDGILHGTISVTNNPPGTPPG
jgi:hypothetical protein